ncbi:hypothetical protein CMUS01_10138 [Colletotrichum musicola]|uniref:Mitochondrial export protein Som1 n=1 Tax=Colletotrichum musicola TaxID=2175873 RepID=A0A8H6K3X2_9PEZI|nr:hypothetical protein CMUS01_10138 [Colletotrichum musicola]
MTPPCVVFPASELRLHVQADMKGKKRKVEGGGDVDLSKCALQVMTQWRCFVENPGARDSPVGCWPIQRLFRQCQDKRGRFTVETTLWEQPSATAQPGTEQVVPESPPGHGVGENRGSGQRTYHEWSQAWEDER